MSLLSAGTAAAIARAVERAQATAQEVLDAAMPALQVGGDLWTRSRRSGSSFAGPRTAAPDVDVAATIHHISPTDAVATVAEALIASTSYHVHAAAADIQPGDVLTDKAEPTLSFTVRVVLATEPELVALAVSS